MTVRTALAGTASSSLAKHFEPSFVDRRWLKGLYLCMLALGEIRSDVCGYCYFGVFADVLLDFFDHYRPNQPFNPSQLKAIVLARSTGQPTASIREFMRQKFSFDDEMVVLEISRGA
jgi:hypothetical protein